MWIICGFVKLTTDRHEVGDTKHYTVDLGCSFCFLVPCNALQYYLIQQLLLLLCYIILSLLFYTVSLQCSIIFAFATLFLSIILVSFSSSFARIILAYRMSFLFQIIL